MIIRANGVSLYYEVRGSGLPLILLHGNGEDHTIFNELAKALESRFTLYLMDSRDHGQSEKTGRLSYAAMAEDVFAFISGLRLGRVNLLGFSDGAIAGLLLAMGHGECLGKLALLGVNLTPEDFTEESYQFVKDTYAETKDPLFKLMLEQPRIELEEVKNIRVPTLVIGAENDIFKPDTFPRLAGALPNATLQIMAGHDHDSYIAHTDMLSEDLIGFFES